MPAQIMYFMSLYLSMSCSGVVVLLGLCHGCPFFLNLRVLVQVVIMCSGLWEADSWKILAHEVNVKVPKPSRL